jgi:indolepyruvate ferredoxin oxidoreductase
VVSDLRISTSPFDGATNKAVAGSADLYLAFDILVALAPNTLIAASPDRTIAVVSTTRTPTGQMIGRPVITFPDERRMREAIDAQTRAGNVYVDAAAVTGALFGRRTAANIFLLGVAFQLGTVPLLAASVERAVELNGVAVEANLQAFRWGRMWVADRARVERTMQHTGGGANSVDAWITDVLNGVADEGLRRILAIRLADLVRYQDAAYARRYLATVVRVHDAEARAVPGSVRLTTAVARNLYKLMAYKDEYEVARLLLEHQLGAVAGNGRDVDVYFNLHPPILRAVGLDRKLRFGPSSRPVFAALARLKKLRGTPLDPFGYAEVRRVERRLRDDYVATLDEVLRRLDPDLLDDAVTIAELPDVVRGYEHVKLNNVTQYESQRHDLLASIRRQREAAMQ